MERRKDSKVFFVGSEKQFLIGFTASFRSGQLLRYSLKPPAHDATKDTHEYMCTDFVDAVRSCFKSGGYSHISNNQETGGQFLVGYRGRLFEIDSDYQVGEVYTGYTAVGCGMYYALASLYTTNVFGGLDPLKRVEQALECAQEFSGGVRAPWVIETLPAWEEPKRDEGQAA